MNQEGAYIANFCNLKTNQHAALRAHPDGRIELLDALGDRSRFFDCMACAMHELRKYGFTKLVDVRSCAVTSHVRSEGFF